MKRSMKTAAVVAVAGLALTCISPAESASAGGGWFGMEQVCVRGDYGVYVSTVNTTGSDSVYIAKNSCKKMGRAKVGFKHVKGIYVSPDKDIRTYLGTPTSKWKYKGRSKDYTRTGWQASCRPGVICANYYLMVRKQ